MVFFLVTPREDVERGQVVVKPGSVTPHTDFKGTAYILSKDEGGRHNSFYANYRPQFYLRTTAVTGVITCRWAPRWSCPATPPT